MKRPTSIRRNQLALALEPQAKQKLEGETREALIAALADLLLEAYGMEEQADIEGQGGRDER